MIECTKVVIRGYGETITAKTKSPVARSLILLVRVKLTARTSAVDKLTVFCMRYVLDT